MNRSQLFASAVLSASLLAGCTPYYHRGGIEDDNLVEVSFVAVEQLQHSLKQPLPRGSLVVINSLVNVDNLGQDLPFGRIVSDQLSSAMSHAGYRVMGIELPTEILVKNEAGILQLPVDTKTALQDAHADALVIGTYAAGRQNIYVSLRIIEIASQNVISSTDYSIPMGPDAKRMATIPAKE